MHSTAKASIYTISTAKTILDTGETLKVGLGKFAWLNLFVIGLIFLPYGFYMIFQGDNSFLFGVVCLSMFYISSLYYPLQASLTFDFASCQVSFSARYLTRFPAKLSGLWQFSQVVRASSEKNFLRQHRASLLMADGNRFMLEFGKKTEVDRFFQRMDAIIKYQDLINSAVPEAVKQTQVVEQAQISEDQALMQRELRSWVVWLFVIGVFQMIAAKGFSPWGALLMLIGLVSLYFHEAAMFIVFAATVAWAGISNLLSGEITWIGFSIVQFILFFQLIRQFQRFHKLQRGQGGQEIPSRARKIFPWAALVLGGAGFLAIVLMFVIAFLVAALNYPVDLNPIFSLGEAAALYAGLLGLATGCASLASGFPRKAASIIGCVMGTLVILVELGLFLLG